MSELQRSVAAQLRQCAALVQGSLGDSPALRRLAATLATVVPEIPQSTNHLLGKGMALELLERILKDFSTVELLLVAQVCRQLAEVAMGLITKDSEQGVFLKDDTMVWGGPLTRRQAGFILMSIIQLKPKIRLVIDGNIVIPVNEDGLQVPQAMLCRALNSLQAATIINFSDDLARRFFKMLALRTDLKVLRIISGFWSSACKGQELRTVAPSTVVRAVSKLERLELTVSKEFRPYIKAILLSASEEPGRLAEIVLAFRSLRSRKFTMNLSPEVLAKAAAKLRVFTVEKAMLKMEQVRALEQVPGRVDSLGDRFIHIHTSGACSPSCTVEREAPSETWVVTGDWRDMGSDHGSD